MSQGSSPEPGTIRERLEQALAGEPVHTPIFAVYDWFVRNRPIDWPSLFERGLGQINHADLVCYRRPHLELVETSCTLAGQTRRDVRWITDIGELHEWYLGEWQQEYPIKTAADYRIMQRAWLDTTVIAIDDQFDQSEQAVGNGGITIGQLGRTPFQQIQIDYVGLERFSYDIADQATGLLDLLELMNDLKLQEFRSVLPSAARYLKLWENLSIETMGPVLYREYLVPLYHQLFGILEGSGKQLHVHYDGKLAVVADQIRGLPFAGLDSLTPPPEGDVAIAEARCCWPDKFLWLHPTLTWYSLPPLQLARNIRQMTKDAGPARYCLMVSEEVPPNWATTLPLVLDTLNGL
jgi:hypothetical protein